ncbi:MAG: hypothetical protein QM708_15980 [Propioniciclava sp.]|uniref:hypothetical protein n=1 Tax=Propioniciclava sp. TaxID=2038686 RepID=UPI0039E5C7E3
MTDHLVILDVDRLKDCLVEVATGEICRGEVLALRPIQMSADTIKRCMDYRRVNLLMVKLLVDGRTLARDATLLGLESLYRQRIDVVSGHETDPHGRERGRLFVAASSWDQGRPCHRDRCGHVTTDAPPPSPPRQRRVLASPDRLSCAASQAATSTPSRSASTTASR